MINPRALVDQILDRLRYKDFKFVEALNCIGVNAIQRNLLLNSLFYFEPTFSDFKYMYISFF